MSNSLLIHFKHGLGDTVYVKGDNGGVHRGTIVRRMFKSEVVGSGAHLGEPSAVHYIINLGLKQSAFAADKVFALDEIEKAFGE